MIPVTFQDWRAENAHSQYPFSDIATLVTTSGERLRAGMFIDAAIFVSRVAEIRLTEMVCSASGVLLWFGDNTAPRHRKAQIDFSDTSDAIAITTSTGVQSGTLVIDRKKIIEITSWSLGTKLFRPGSSELVASALHPLPDKAVTSFDVPSGEVFSGDVWLVGENGVVLRHDNGAIRVDVVGDPLFRRKLCEPLTDFSPPRFLRSINGVEADSQQNFQFTISSTEVDKPSIRIFQSGDSALTIEQISDQF